MLKLSKRLILIGLVALSPNTAIGGACDYRPSNLMGGVGTGAAVATGGAVAAVGTGAKAAGFYTLTNAVTGATMLGSTAGGASAAGTVGIMGGTAGAVGTVASVVMAPATIIAGAVLGVGVAAYEGACYFTVERVDDPDVIEGIIDNLTLNSDPEFLRRATIAGEDYLMVAVDHDEEMRAVDWKQYRLSKLYIEEGMLKHSDLGPNTQIGRVSVVGEQLGED
ncbi:hypothetical protein OIU14_07465 [Thalassobacter stenotrophicus]|uniref:hypothetical protein n=1 Tax=Thalassobacter stenotrophicus TaxID=266809 RepID=UPI0022A9D608|nr:hypothetical protein [Thalassobacter stenotrophicus]UYP69551.1 hypothetical protein OIU14_07465 [Thalassobacter stenotrophicus]